MGLRQHSGEDLGFGGVVQDVGVQDLRLLGCRCQALYHSRLISSGLGSRV